MYGAVDYDVAGFIETFGFEKVADKRESFFLKHQCAENGGFCLNGTRNETSGNFRRQRGRCLLAFVAAIFGVVGFHDEVSAFARLVD